jgi:hypothetical protein
VQEALKGVNEIRGRSHEEKSCSFSLVATTKVVDQMVLSVD